MLALPQFCKMKIMKNTAEKSKNNSLPETGGSKLNFKETGDLFKIAFRNYVSLISVADRKAGLLIHVNSITVSVVIAFTLRNMDRHPLFLIPIIMLLLVALCTIYFAIRASKPQEKLYATNFHQNEKFFFGSVDRTDNEFLKVSWDEYNENLRLLINGNKQNVLDQIVSETFMVRKALSRKFKFLSIAYKVFKFGLIIAITSFVTVYLITS